ncbi:xyloglucan endo-transglycosylase [Fusarium heterosporum]|uniref:Xyloglucan endo-transglycosylase n=1 Tax=Fusarium heterosporum TaxID=42747 RepID=A0A8H5TBL4_FUSHE|nr:xyloglucan endo-transglycosylase [Fusarium heterosporum]
MISATYPLIAETTSRNLRTQTISLPAPQQMTEVGNYQPEEVRVAKISGPKDNNAVTALTFLSSRQNESSQQSSGMDFGDENILRQIDDIVGFNTQPTLDIRNKYIPGSHWNMSMPGNASWEAWNNYRMDWVADQVVWYTNGIEMANTSVNVPSVPCRLSVSLWGNGGTWTRNMTLGKSALLEVQWLEVAFNLSGTRPSEKGMASCKLDSDAEDGKWKPYIFPPAHGSLGSRIEFSIFATCMISFLVINLF